MEFPCYNRSELCAGLYAFVYDIGVVGLYFKQCRNLTWIMFVPLKTMHLYIHIYYCMTVITYMPKVLNIQVAVVALIFEVQRSARSEARKEEARKQELEVCAIVSLLNGIESLFDLQLLGNLDMLEFCKCLYSVAILLSSFF